MPRKRLYILAHIRFTPEQMDAMRRRARANGTTVTEEFRRAVEESRHLRHEVMGKMQRIALGWQGYREYGYLRTEDAKLIDQGVRDLVKGANEPS